MAAVAMLPIGMFLLVTLSPPAHADSDGYFCTGPDYLAYQFAFSHGGTQHVLTVVSLRDGETGSVVLPFFQSHGMLCSPSTVKMKGWQEVHRIDISDRLKPAYRGKIPAESEDESGYSHQNLGPWPMVQGRLVGAGETVIPLGADGGPPLAQLRLRIQESRVPDGFIRQHETDLVLTDQGGGGTTVRRLFTGFSEESVD
jgi:hypothetical protein